MTRTKPAPPDQAEAIEHSAAFDSTLTPSRPPVACRTLSVTTAMAAAVSYPCSPGLRNGMSQWFSTMRPWQPPSR
nr:hypothetical protein [Actinomadura madurae]